MALITRFSRLFRADLHAVLDRLEEPDILLRQALREMEEDVLLRTRAQKARELERNQAVARIAEIEQAQTRLAAELDLCFRADNEVLARTLLRRRLENERLAQQLSRMLAQLTATLAEQESLLDEQRRRLAGMQSRAAVFESDPRRGDAGSACDATVVTDADVEVALLREKQARSAS